MKLANILTNFNNFLKVQEKMNKTMNDCQDTIKTLLPIETFSVFKSQVLNNSSKVNENLKKIFIYNDNTDLILNDLKNTDENNLNLLLKKIKIITDKEESFFADKHQENLSYIKDHKNIILSKINRLKGFRDGIQAQMGEEMNLRKISDEKIMKEVTTFIDQKYDEKFKTIEKNALETEKNLINMNKDCMKTFQEIITKQKDGNESEFQNIKHMMEIGLKKYKFLYENDINEMKKLISSMKGELNDSKSIVEKIDGFVKENVKIMSEFRIEGDKSILDFSAKMKQIEQDSLKLYEQTKKNILKEYNDNINKENEKRDAFEKKINDRISSQLHSYDNNINDLKERCTQLKKMFDNDYAVGKNTLGINSLKFDEIYTNKFNNLNKDIQDNNKKLREELEKKVNSLRNYIKKSMDDYSVHVDNDLYKKFEVLSGDFKDKIDKSKIELDGKMQQYFVECELRLKKQYEEFISKKK
jgi:hypothetical protein